MGFLLICKKKGLIKELKPLIIKLRNNKRFYSDNLIEVIIKEAGE
ncbi:MAG: DUF3368 domain-containing protein [Candidatus Cloacimonetes bacterium]|nr:DUF3368 domain-containing protein [Candidatus Cloacimonadota bacterium]